MPTYPLITLDFDRDISLGVLTPTSNEITLLADSSSNMDLTIDVVQLIIEPGVEVVIGLSEPTAFDLIAELNLNPITMSVYAGAPGERGPAGADASGLAKESLSFNFSYGDAPQILYTMPSNGRIISAGISIRVAFDGTAPTIKLGHNSNVDSLISADELDPKIVGQYSVEPDVDVLFTDLIKLTIFPDSSSMGSGVVRLLVSYT